MAEKARRVSPGGVSQTFRQVQPFPLFYDHARGSRKTTVDGQELIDYCMGHGSLLFGHRHPEIEDAAVRQLGRANHFAAPTQSELDLATLVCEIVPCAESVRFCGTGSEACAAVIRLARAVMKRPKFIRFEGHYHGWHDEFFHGLRPPFAKPMSAGIPAEATANQLRLAPGSLEAVEEALAERDDIAAIFVEAAGGTHGTIPTTIEWLKGLRELCDRYGTLLIFDEMVSGFRLAPGGYQEWSGVTPDLATFGKALFGGFPGGAVAGRADLMRYFAAGEEFYVAHNGSWNAFPVACAAGARTLELLRDGKVHAHINSFGERLRAELNARLLRKGIDCHVYGVGSHIHFLFEPWPFQTPEVPFSRHGELTRDPNVFRMFRLAMWVNGVDFAFGNNVSAAHTDEDFAETCERFEKAMVMMADEGLVPRSV